MASTTASPKGTPVEPEVPRIDQVIEGLILLLLLYLPLAFGGVMPTSRIVMVAFGSLIAACFAVRCIAEPNATIVKSWAFVPAIGLLLLAVLQMTPLPMSVIGVLSPTAADVWQQAAEASGEPMKWATLSVYPHGTQRDIVLLACGVIVLVVGASIYRHQAAFQRLLTGVALIGLLVSLIGLAQIALGADGIYWYFQGPGNRVNSGPFASYSHYSEFINLALGCALGILVIRAASRGPTRKFELSNLLDYSAHNMGRVDKALCAFLAIGVIAIVLSTSRNGPISLVVAAGVVAAAMHTTKKVEGIGWPIIGFAFACTIALLLLGVDPIIERFEGTAEAPVGAMSTRLELVRDTASMTMSYPVFGSGVGTYELAFPAFDTSMRGGTAEHAENQYMEVLAEMGLLGGALAAALVVLSFVMAVRRVRAGGSRTDLGMFGLLFALVAIGFHSLTDFGLEIPAVGMVVAALLAAIHGRTGTAIRNNGRTRVAGGAAAAAGAVILVSTLDASFKAAEGSDSATMAAAIRKEIDRGREPTSPETMAELGEQAAFAAASDPSNVDHLFWSTFSEWNSAVIRAQASYTDDSPVSPLTHPDLRHPARQAVDRLTESLRAGPTHGPTWSVAGQLRRIWLEEPESEGAKVAGDWILRGRALTPHHPSTCMAAAFELLRRQQEVAGLEELARAVTVGGSKYGVVDLLARDLDRPSLALPFAEGHLGLTERLLVHVRNSQKNAALESKLNQDFESLLRVACASPGATAHELVKLARLERERGGVAEAIDLFRRVLSVDPYSRHRFDYAKLLQDEGDLKGARRELRDVLRFHPNHMAATNMLSKLESAHAN